MKIKLLPVEQHILESLFSIFNRYSKLEFKDFTEPLTLECFALIHAHIISWSEGKKLRQIGLKRHKLV